MYLLTEKVIMVRQEYVSRVQNLINQAAKSKGTVSFVDLFAVFPEKTPLDDVYDTLEAASANLARWGDAIYSVVMAKKSTGLPGDGFFDIYRIHRRDGYKAICNGSSSLNLTESQKKEMVDLEKARVYDHAQWQG